MAVPERAVFHTLNLIDETNTVLEASNEVLPVDNVKHTLRSKVWMTDSVVQTDGSYHWIKFYDSTGLSLSIKALGIINCNLTSNDYYRIQASDYADFSDLKLDLQVEAQDPLYSIGSFPVGFLHAIGGYLRAEELNQFVPGGYIKTVYLEEAVEALYWRILFEVSDPSSFPDTYIQVGRLFAGACIEVNFNPEWNWEFIYEDKSEVSESEGGVFWVDTKPTRRVIKCTFPWVDLGQKYGLFYDWLVRFGKRKDIILELFPGPWISKPEKFFTRLYGRARSWSSLVGWNKDYSRFEIEFVEAL